MPKSDDSVSIIPTQFLDVRSKEVTYGYRAFDNEIFIYGNALDEIPSDNLEFLKLVVENADDALHEMLEGSLANKDGLFIGETWYEYDDVVDIIDPQ